MFLPAYSFRKLRRRTRLILVRQALGRVLLTIVLFCSIVLPAALPATIHATPLQISSTHGSSTQTALDQTPGQRLVTHVLSQNGEPFTVREALSTTETLDDLDAALDAALDAVLDTASDAAQQGNGSAVAEAAPSAADEQVERLLAAMSPADRVGQLFVITFKGDEVGLQSDIADLIVRLRVGGVVLDPRHENFSNDLAVQTSAQVAALTNQLQALAYDRLLSPEQALAPPLPDAAEPDAAQPDAAQPDAAQPDAAQPDAAQPNIAADEPMDESSFFATLPPIVVTTRTITATRVITAEATPASTSEPPISEPTTEVITEPTTGVITGVITSEAQPASPLPSPSPTLVITSTETFTEIVPVLITASEPVSPPLGIPLLIGIRQAGDDWPDTALRSGPGVGPEDAFVPLPSQMAIGATWNPNYATQVGAITGEQLRAVGVNLLLGPNLDMIEQPVANANGIGVQSFGGNPYWVSQMSRAYIAGVHGGSNGRVATIARSFPGQGGSDRPPGQEVATIQKSLEALRATSLQPFFAVTQLPESSVAPNPTANSLLAASSVTDGVMTANSRYVGVQNTAASREPFSVSPGLSTLLQSSEIAPWREQGIVMSDALGLPAIRRFYDPTLETFPQRQVAAAAFTAGHDLLYLAQFSADGEWASQRDNVEDVINLFRARYADPNTNFSAQVDERVRRILRLKLELYGLLTDDEPPVELAPADEPITGTSLFSEPIADASSFSTADSLTLTQIITPPTAGAELDVDGSSSMLGNRTSNEVIGVPLDTVLTPASARETLLANAGTHLTIVNEVANQSITALRSLPPRPDGEPVGGESVGLDAPKAEDTVLVIGDARHYMERLDGEKSFSSSGGGASAAVDEFVEATGLVETGSGSLFALGPNGIVRIAERLFGQPDSQGDETATGQVNINNFSDWTFLELADVLNQYTAGTIELGALGANAPAAAPAENAADQNAADGETTAAEAGATSGTGLSETTADQSVVDESAETTAEAVDESVDGAQASTASAVDMLSEPAVNNLAAPASESSGEPKTRSEELAEQLQTADWIIFAMLDVDTVQHPSSNVVKRFLNDLGDEYQDKTIVVLALNAPYFLDATEVGLTDAYYGVYSKTEPFLENAIQTLFNSSASPTGAPPVSVPGTPFADLAERLSVAPEQALPLGVTLRNEPIALTEVGGVDSPVDNAQANPFEAGEVLSLIVGPIQDLNGHPVPDLTPVDFQLRYESEGAPLASELVGTVGGYATRNVVLERGGALRIQAQSGGATSAQYLLNLQNASAPASVAQGVGDTDNPSTTVTGEPSSTAGLAVTQPLSTVTGSGENAVSPELTGADAISNVAGEGLTGTETPAASEDVSGAGDNASGGAPDEPNSAIARRTTPASFAIALLTIMVTVFVVLILQVRIVTRPMLVHQVLWAIVAGLVAYIIYSIGFLPGATWMQQNLQPVAVAPIVFVAMLLPLLWLQLRGEH